MLGIGHDVQFFNAQTQCDPDGFGCGFKLHDVIVLDKSMKKAADVIRVSVAYPHTDRG